jgi:hypothetical protein
MTNLEIITKANEIVKGANFTKIMKVRKNAGPAFLIAALGNGLSIYGSYTSDTIYANWNKEMVRLA